MDAAEAFAYTDPFALFSAWMAEAEAAEPSDPNAAALATADANGAPSVRMVLVKRVDAHGFCFYTNADSHKGRDLLANPRAALCFHWKSLRRQVRVDGPVSRLDSATVDAYFHSRGRRSQLGAAVSRQSHVLESRAVLEQQVAAFAAEHPGEVPRPELWHGYCVAPDSIEFWMDGPDRLHDRLIFLRQPEGGWATRRLYP